jgi:predicted nucleotidyltransferase
MNFGISEKSYTLILSAFHKFPEVEKVLIYGSRAIGNYKSGSDIDLAVSGANISTETILKLKTLLEQELPIPYYFDITHYETISNSALKKHIDEFGKLFYQAEQRLLTQ